LKRYTGFAEVYDAFMDNIPYDDWAKYLIALMKLYRVPTEGQVVDLGCGTGNVTERLARAGYSCVGIDLSVDMLTIAEQKRQKDELPIIYSQQDMRSFAIPEPADCLVSLADAMNYMLNDKDLKQTFQTAHTALRDDGVFIFDLKTIHFFQDVLADHIYAENREDSAYIWENFYYDETHNNEYDLSIFVKDMNGQFTRFEETHVQHGFTTDEVTRLARECGFKVEAFYDALTYDRPKKDSERIYVVLRKQR
jgi:SAM-dependent methyltransferase